MVTASGVYTSISGLWLLQHSSIRPVGHDPSCICNGQTPRALHVEQMPLHGY
jgi:hypothetical protein